MTPGRQLLARTKEAARVHFGEVGREEVAERGNAWRVCFYLQCYCRLLPPTWWLFPSLVICPSVPATPCLDWQPMPAAGGAAVQAFVPHWRTLRAFLRGDALSELTHFVSLLPVLLLDFF